MVFVVLNSCQNNETGKEDGKAKSKKSYIEIANEQLALNSNDNSTFLEFTLGATKQETQKHISTLIKEKKLKRESTLDLNIATINGYPYQLQLNDTVTCECVVVDNYFDNKLYSLTAYVFGDSKNKQLIGFLTSIYGEPNYEEVKNEGYVKNKKLYWISGNKQVLLTEIAPFNVIEFTDLRLKMKDKELRAAIDTLKAEIGKEKLKESHADFK